jgi:hypothetical protein
VNEGLRTVSKQTAGACDAVRLRSVAWRALLATRRSPSKLWLGTSPADLYRARKRFDFSGNLGNLLSIGAFRYRPKEWMLFFGGTFYNPQFRCSSRRKRLKPHSPEIQVFGSASQCRDFDEKFLENFS